MTTNQDSGNVTRHRQAMWSYAQQSDAQAPYPQDPYAQMPYPQDPYVEDPYVQQPYVNSPYGQDPYATPTWANATNLNDTRVDDRYVNESYVGEQRPIWYGSAEDTLTDAVARQRRRYGGLKIGSTFFGWLTTMAMAFLLTALAAAVGAAAGLAGNATMDSTIQAISGNLTGVAIGTAAALLLIVAIAFFCGGYVAARMARFHGAAHGLAVWVWALIVVTITTVVATGQADRYNLAAVVDGLPRLSINQDVLAKAGLVAAVILALTALAAAVIGGVAGDRYHRRVDRAAWPWLPS